jgi:dipeptidyl aminopeptidase/acylaminoacyl peptidase
MRTQYLLLLSLMFAVFIGSAAANPTAKPKVTLDEFFNSVSFGAVKVSPDGHSVVIATDRADWEQNIFRHDLWLYGDRDNGGRLTQLTQSGQDSEPQWSPDGRWLAFLSERSPATRDLSEDSKGKGDVAQIYLISPAGGESFGLTHGEEEVHSFAWSPDSRSLYFATRTPWSKTQKEAYKKDWKDVNQYRAAERGDQIFSIEVADAIERHQASGASSAGDDDNNQEPDATPGARTLASIPWRVQQIAASPDSRRLALVTESVSERTEKIDEFEIYSVDLAGATPARPPRQLTHNEAQERDIRWDKEGRHIFFNVEIGSVEGKYVDVQPRLYSVDADTGASQRWASDFGGEITHYAFLENGGLLATGRLGTEIQVYTQASASAVFSKQAGWPGTYESLDAAAHSPRVAFVHSTVEKPTEVYLAESVDRLQDARPITSFNKLFTERDLPKGKPYRWIADDGTSIEGMLIYPPGKFEAKNLPMFTLIHGGPIDADGNHFEADWYQWDRLAANQGWLVFEPNYRGSSGYGDEFVKGIVPQLVSRPGKDILEGVDALARDGIADLNHLGIGGYSYGGYMTNWLITQSTRWKVAVTGAGAVEHVANWGNDDTTLDDAYYLGGLPWEAAQRYQLEAAIFQMNKVRTPTHVVAGADDIRVAVAEDYLLEHALHNLGVPSTLLVFPGEGHSLDKNPWHGKIKVREELKWLEKYGEIEPGP